MFSAVADHRSVADGSRAFTSNHGGSVPRRSIYDEGGNAVALLVFFLTSFGVGWVILSIASSAGLSLAGWVASGSPIVNAVAVLIGIAVVQRLRHTRVGCVAERAVGKLVFRTLWTIGEARQR